MIDKEYIEVFDAYRMYVFYFCKKIIKHKEDAEDITCEVFISLWKNKENIPSNSAKAFLMVTANRRCQDYFRMKKHYQERVLIFSLQDFDEVEIDAEVLTYLHKLIQTLLPQEKKILLLKYKDGKEVKQISKLLQIKPQTVSTQLNTGLNKLRAIINSRGFNHS